MRKNSKTLAMLAAVSLIAMNISAAQADPRLPTATSSTDDVCRTIMTDQKVAGKAYYIGAHNPTDIARAIEISLHDDPSGMTTVKLLKKGDQANASPMQWYCSVKAVNPGANLPNVAALPDHFRGLIKKKPSGEVWSGCIVGKLVRIKCQKRYAMGNEWYWGDPVTGADEMQMFCSNIIFGPAGPRCYTFSFDYTMIADQVKWQLTTAGQFAIVSHELSLTEEQMRRLYADDCFFIEDSAGHRKPTAGCDEIICPPGSVYPNIELARIVGLPDRRLPTTVYSGFKDGKGIFSLPIWAAQALTDYVPCVAVKIYPVTAPGYRGWRAPTRFNRAQGFQIRPTIPSGHYDKVFQGEGHY